ncbi:uncharacterized protein LOC141720881 isoform X6 [Apium graveolens]|uniref:uncharacterized protein LOC141720881 isoform X6 n=1 Tax=Apium graveolens TaxID=4045 RepID=UPI003D79F4CD
MDRSWINIRDKLSEEYTKGVSEFIGVAKKFVNSKGMVLCPCCRCINKQSQALNVIKLHLVTHGFLSTYKIWYYHGEQIDDLEDEVIFDDQDWDSRDEQDDLAEGLNDANNTKYFDVGPTSDLIKDSSSKVNENTAGKLACPMCLEDTRSRRITDKQYFTGHRCYLNKDHPWRKSKEYDGSSEFRGPPRNFTGEDILKQLEEVPVRTTGKSPNNLSRKQKRGANDLNWSKRSILFDLPYWSNLLLRHNLDVMHIEKNVCDNIVGTLLDIEGVARRPG